MSADRLSPPLVNLGYDFDDVLVETGPAVMRLYNEAKGTDLTIDDWYDYDVDLTRWRIGDFSEAVSLINDFFANRPEAFLPLPGAVDFLRKRSAEGWRQHIITGRPSLGRTAILATIEEHFDGCDFASLSFTDHFKDGRHEGPPLTKAEFCAQHEINIFFDDLPVHAESVARSGVRTVLFGDYPWNRESCPLPNLRRTSNWNDMEDIFSELTTL